MNPKLGILLSAVAGLGGSGALPTYYRPKTYENKKIDLDRVTNSGKMAQSVSTFVQGGASGPCAGVNQTITSTGITLVTMTCTGTVNMSGWGAGSVAAGGGFAKSAISVTNGQVFTAYVGTVSSSATATFICDHSVANCKVTAGGVPNGPNCNTPAGLSTANLVCAASAQFNTPGSATNSVGVIAKFTGGAHYTTGYLDAGGGGAGPDGNGLNGTSTHGGAGDNGSGGAGGLVSGSHNGVSNPLGGGGGACNNGPNGVTGGLPGGGSPSCNAAFGAPGGGQIVIHGELDPELQILTGGSGYGGGTISVA